MLPLIVGEWSLLIEDPGERISVPPLSEEPGGGWKLAREDLFEGGSVSVLPTNSYKQMCKGVIMFDSKCI